MLTLPYMKLSNFEFLSLTQNLFSLYWREEVDYASSIIDGVIVVGLSSSIVVVFGVPIEVWKIVDTGLLEAMLALLTLAPEQLVNVPLMTWKQNCQICISCIWRVQMIFADRLLFWIIVLLVPWALYYMSKK